MEQIELIEKRKPREKHFLQKDGTIRAEIYAEDVHYLKDGKYVEIDNSLVEEGDCFINKNNSYKVEFNKDINNSLVKISKDGSFLNLLMKDYNSYDSKKISREIDKNNKNIIFSSISDDVSFEHKINSDKVKETIIIKNGNYTRFSFEVDTNLKLKEDNGGISALDDNNKILFHIEKPFMYDMKNNYCDNVRYFIYNQDGKDFVDLILDEKWLNEENRVFPVYVDPTISNNSDNVSFQDTYIYPGDTSDSNGSKPYLKSGVELVNNNLVPNRSLIKFSLPTIGTGSEIVYASLSLTSYPTYTPNPSNRFATIHQVTSDWDETTAKWANMNDKYNDRVESIFYGQRSTILNNEIIPASSYYDGNITNIVKKWYRNEPNYGLMIKSLDETTYVDDNYPMFYSNDNNVSGDINPKPLVSIVYRNHNGLENYLDYKKQEFSCGSSFINTYNGNMTMVVDLISIINETLPVGLKLIYNSNDVVLNNTNSLKSGFKFNLEQKIRNVNINNTELLEYDDEDGTIHYFHLDTSSNKYQDEDGLGLSILKDDDTYIMYDTAGGKKYFVKNNDEYIITKIEDSNNNYFDIILNTNGTISKITDQHGTEIQFVYNRDYVEITSQNENVKINYSNNFISSIEKNLGVVSFSYNSFGLIETILDLSGIKYYYEYYSNSPYRVLRVTKKGVNDEVGQFIEFNYGFDCTNVTKNNGLVITIIYNSYGNAISKNILSDNEDLDSAYSIKTDIGQSVNNMNKTLSNEHPIKFIKNFLKNSSFENDNIDFLLDSGIDYSFDLDNNNSGFRSLKLMSQENNKKIQKAVSVQEGNYYTFSCYIKNDSEVKLSLHYFNSKNERAEESQIVTSNSLFDREDISIYYDDALSDLMIEIDLLTKQTIYIDDMQLELGEVANSYNLIENPDFSEGFNDWILDSWTYDDSSIDPSSSFSIVNFNDGKKHALKVSTSPNYGVSFSKIIPMKGKKGDLYTCSFWYKNLGIPGFGRFNGSAVSIYFKPIGKDAEYCIETSDFFNPNEDKWQFFTYKSHAPEDFEYIKLVFLIGREANDFYVTNLSLYKNVTGGEYSYDSSGNLILLTNQNSEENTFKYNSSNKLILSTDSMGNNCNIEYDINNADRIISASSDVGIVNNINYNNYGSPICTIISKKFPITLDDGQYKIRCRGTNKFLKSELNTVLAEENECSNTLWYILSTDDNQFKIGSPILPGYYICYEKNEVFFSNTDHNNKFFIEKNVNNAYYIYTRINDCNMYLKNNTSSLSLEVLDEKDSTFEFYFEYLNSLFLQNDVGYSEDGRHLVKYIDYNVQETNYTYDSDGLLNSVTLPNNQMVSYTYNSKKQLSKIVHGNKEVNYEYNSNNTLKKITMDDREYNFLYDSFLNVNSIKINDSITLVTNKYDNSSGNLISKSFGNSDAITYNYDEYDRIVNVKKGNDIYEIKYDNNGNVGKIISNTFKTKKYNYDPSNRLYKYAYDDFEAKYNYNSNNIIKSKSYTTPFVTIDISNTFMDDGRILSSSILNNILEYEYDSLNRVIGRKINNKRDFEIEYLKYGNRTTDLIKRFSNKNDFFEFQYDNMGNIVQIKKNHNIEKIYQYNIYNELICSIDLARDTKTEYEYDLYGNMTKNTLKVNSTNTLIEQHNFTYNSDWVDQVVSYDNNTITYDSAGNVINIGDNVTLNWKNGHELKEYNNISSNCNALYDYDENGIRTAKTVNGITTNYYLDGINIVLEKKENDYIYYIRDSLGSLVGFNYNGEVYWYVKNIHDDVTGIVNINDNLIVQYEYDDYGNIINIIDISTNNLGELNPYRYRSYYYDKETGLYYLNKRYYSPSWKRFISPDTSFNSESLHNGYNLYIYADNNPVMLIDETGRKKKTSFFDKLSGLAKSIKSTATSIYKKVKKTIVDTVNFLYSVSDTINRAFIFEAGVGYGTKVSNNSTFHKFEVGASHSFGFGVHNNEAYQYTNEGYFFPELKIAGVNFGYSKEWTSHDPSTEFILPFQVYKANDVTESSTYFSDFKRFNYRRDENNQTLFIGYNFSEYIGFGADFKIGFEFDL